MEPVRWKLILVDSTTPSRQGTRPMASKHPHASAPSNILQRLGVKPPYLPIFSL
jgi:hypothetical protein